MGGNNTKVSHTEVCINPNIKKWFSMGKISFTIQCYTKTKQVSLQEIEFRILVPARRFYYPRICSVSNDFYLITDYMTQSVVKLQLSSGNLWILGLPGIVTGLFFLEQNRAAAAIADRNHNLIYILQTKNSMLAEKVIEIADVCNGVAQIRDMVYICQPYSVVVYNRNGERERKINVFGAQKTLISMAKGPENTLVCLIVASKSIFMSCDSFVNVVDTNGRILKTIYRQDGPFLKHHVIRTDTEGNVYIFNYQSCWKITTEGNLKKFNPPETKIADVCYDTNIDMLVFLHPEFLDLKSPDFCQPAKEIEVEAEEERSETGR